MKPTTLTTVSTSFASSSQQEKKHKQRDKARKHRGRSVPIPGIWVNQALGKIKLDEDVPPVVKMEINDGDFRKETSEDNEGVTFTEEFTVTVTKEDVSFQSSEDSEEGQEYQSRKSSCSCREEIESLKHSVKQLNLQVKKQNQVIAGIKSSLRNAVLSLMTCCQDEEDDGGQDFQESPVIVSTCSKVCGPEADDPLIIVNTENVSSACEDASHSDNLQDSRSPIPVEECSNDSLVEIPTASATNSSSSNEVGLSASSSTEGAVDMDNDDDNVKEDADLDEDDNYYVPDDSEVESDKDIEDDDHSRQGNQFKSAESFTTEGITELLSNSSNSDSAGNSEGGFPCSKCGKNYKTKKTLYDHMRDRHSGRIFKCHLCPKVLKHRTSLIQHVSSTHERVRYKCAYCPVTIYRKIDVKRHERRVHPEGGGPSTQNCKACGLHFKSEKSLHIHMGRMHKRSATNRRAKNLHMSKKTGNG